MIRGSLNTAILAGLSIAAADFGVSMDAGFTALEPASASSRMAERVKYKAARNKERKLKARAARGKKRAQRAKARR